MVLPAIRVYSIVVSPGTATRTVIVLAAVGCFLPVQVWLVASAARGIWGRKQAWALPAMLVFLAGMLPVVGVGWVGILNVAAALTLVVVRLPWGLLLFALFVVAPTPLTVAAGHPEWAMYFTLSIAYTALPMASGIWLIRTARQLQAARVELAEHAVLRERVRVDEELRSSVGVTLARIGSQATSIRARLDADPPGRAEDLADLAELARRALVDARRVAGLYRESSLRTELEGATTLLAAAGIQARLDMPPDEIAGSLDDAGRRALHRAFGEVLSGRTREVTISVTPTDGAVRVVMHSAGDTWTTEVGAVT